MAVDRDLAINALAQEVTAHLSDAQSVFVYQPNDIAPSTPVVTVLASGDEHPPLTVRGIQARLGFEVNTFVLRSDAAQGYTEQDAAKRQHALNLQMQQMVETHGGETQVSWLEGGLPRSFTWGALEFSNKTLIAPFRTVSGVIYLLEVFYLTMTVYA